ncbi:MAG: 2-oxo acid dehydrogenase subunit E2 [Bacteroidales bacterium]
MKNYQFSEIPRSRIATFDIFSVGLGKHHVSALLEFDVTSARRGLQELRRQGLNISFNAFLIKTIGNVISRNPDAAAYIFNRRKLIRFNDINISVLVEKSINGAKVPVPLVIEKADSISAIEITSKIEEARKGEMNEGDIVSGRDTGFAEKLYYQLPGFLRRLTWHIMLANPVFAYRKMGNVVITSVGMIGKINGWFIHKSIHPVSFGVGSILKKAVVVEDEVKIREILNMTILVDHDVIDGAPMVRMLNDLTRQLENFDPSLLM